MEARRLLPREIDQILEPCHEKNLSSEVCGLVILKSACSATETT